MKKLLLFALLAGLAPTSRAETRPACDKSTLRSVDRTRDFAIAQSLRL